MKNSKAILKTPGTMKIIAADIPVPKEHEVLIKVEYVGICGSRCSRVLNRALLFRRKTQTRKLVSGMNVPVRWWRWEVASVNLNRATG